MNSFKSVHANGEKSRSSGYRTKSMLDCRNSLATLVMTSCGALQFLSVMKGMFIEISNATEISVLRTDDIH